MEHAVPALLMAREACRMTNGYQDPVLGSLLSGLVQDLRSTLQAQWKRWAEGMDEHDRCDGLGSYAPDRVKAAYDKLQAEMAQPDRQCHPDEPYTPHP